VSPLAPSIGVTRLVGPPEAPQEFDPGRAHVTEVVETKQGAEAMAASACNEAMAA
jgi:hypothetical protein